MANAKNSNPTIQNKKAFFDYFIEDKYEAGLALQGWEVKSLRDNRIQLRDAYVSFKNGEAFLYNALFTPMPTASTHIIPEPLRTRKLLLHRREIDQLLGNSEREGYTVVPLRLYWKNNKAKIEIGVARGKKEYDKRDTIKERDWQREKQRIFRKRS